MTYPPHTREAQEWQAGFAAALEMMRQEANQRFEKSEKTGLDSACRYEVMQCLAIVKRQQG